MRYKLNTNWTEFSGCYAFHRICVQAIVLMTPLTRHLSSLSFVPLMSFILFANHFSFSVVSALKNDAGVWFHLGVRFIHMSKPSTSVTSHLPEDSLQCVRYNSFIRGLAKIWGVGTGLLDS